MTDDHDPSTTSTNGLSLTRRDALILAASTGVSGAVGSRYVDDGDLQSLLDSGQDGSSPLNERWPYGHRGFFADPDPTERRIAARTSSLLSLVEVQWDPYNDPTSASAIGDGDATGSGSWRYTFVLNAHAIAVKPAAFVRLTGKEETPDEEVPDEVPWVPAKDGYQNGRFPNQEWYIPNENEINFGNYLQVGAGDRNPGAVSVSARRDPDLLGMVGGVGPDGEDRAISQFEQKLLENGDTAKSFGYDPRDGQVVNFELVEARRELREKRKNALYDVGKAIVGLVPILGSLRRGPTVDPGAIAAVVEQAIDTFGDVDALVGAYTNFRANQTERGQGPLAYYDGFQIVRQRNEGGPIVGHYATFDVNCTPDTNATVEVESGFDPQGDNTHGWTLEFDTPPNPDENDLSPSAPYDVDVKNVDPSEELNGFDASQIADEPQSTNPQPRITVVGETPTGDRPGSNVPGRETYLSDAPLQVDAYETIRTTTEPLTYEWEVYEKSEESGDDWGRVETGSGQSTELDLDAGLYRVELTVSSDDSDASGQSRQEVLLVPGNAPVPKTSHSPRLPTDGDAVTLSAENLNDDVPVEAWEWRIPNDPIGNPGDVNSKFGSEVEHVFEALGDASTTYEVDVVALPDRPGEHEQVTVTENVTVKPGLDLEIVTPDERLAPDDRFMVRVAEQPDEPVSFFQWTFDGAEKLDVLENTDGIGAAEAVASRTGEVEVSLRVETENSSGTSTATVRVVDDLIDVDPGFPYVREQTTFTASTPEGVSNPSFTWTFPTPDEERRGRQVEQSFPDTGIQRVVLTIEGDDDTVEFSREITVVERPEATVTWQPDDPKPRARVEFDASDSTGAQLSFAWSGDVDGTGEQIERTFDEPGEYDVTLRVEDVNETVTRATETLRVAESDPGVEITNEETTITEGDSVKFGAELTDIRELKSYEWIGATETGDAPENPTEVGVAERTFSVPSDALDDPGAIGNHRIQIAVTAGDGETYTDDQRITVEDDGKPTVDLSLEDPENTDVEIGDRLRVRAVGYGETEIVDVEWSGAQREPTGDPSGDATTVDQEAAYEIAEADAPTHEVAVTIEEEDGETASDSIVFDVGRTPSIDGGIAGPTSPPQETPGTYSVDVSDSEGDVARYEWYVDADPAIAEPRTTTTTGEVDLSFEAGSHDLTVVVVDENGLQDSATRSDIVATNEGPTIERIEGPRTVTEGNTVFYRSKLLDDTGIQRANWLGDAESTDGSVPAESDGKLVVGSATQYPLKQPDDGGPERHTATVGLEVEDDDGATASTEFDVIVDDESPALSVAEKTSPPYASGDIVTFEASLDATEPGGVDYQWTGVGSDSGATFSQPITDLGTHSLTVTATDDEGNETTETVSFTVQDEQAPSVSLSADTETVQESGTVSFTGEVSDAYGSITDVSWSNNVSGDTSVGNGTVTASGTFDEPGTHTVSLEVTDDDANGGRSTSDSVQITVQNDAPEITDLSVTTSGRTIEGSVSATSDVTGYRWTVDGSTENVGPNADTLAYTAPSDRTYEVEVTVSDEYNKTDSRSTDVTVDTNSSPSVSLADEETVVGQQVTLSASASDPDGDSLSYSWSGVDSYTGPNASVTYSSAGTNTVTVTVDDGNGGRDSTTATVTVEDVNESPSVYIDALDEVAPGNEVSLTAVGSDPDDDSLSYDWSGVDSSFGKWASVTYSSTGKRTVEVTARDGEGGSDSDIHTINVVDFPNPSITENDDDSLLGALRDWLD